MSGWSSPEDPRLPGPGRVDRIKLITPEELQAWIIHEDDDLLVVNKSGEVVCHPSKVGPASSLVGAVKAYTGLSTAHLVFRLDRETSGVVVLAKHPAMARQLQQAVQHRRIGKRYWAILQGELRESITVDQPLGPDETSAVHVKSCVRPDGKPAVTHFRPQAVGGGFTWAEVIPVTGRKHQIRAHAQYLKRGVVGDKIYGPDERHFLNFMVNGWSPALARALLLPRQALHCREIDLHPAGWPGVFRADLPEDMRDFAVHRMGLETDAIPGA